MSTAKDKAKMSRRRQQEENAVNRQLKIAKSHGLTSKDQAVKQPHRMAKHHVMDCGNPHCYLCGNPRKTHKDRLTAQEKRLFQDTDNIRDKHSNGISNQKDSQ